MNRVVYLLLVFALIGGCSATHHRSSQRVPPKQSATTTPTPTMRDASLASGTPSCPAFVPTGLHSTVVGLATRLVPFVATGVRLCRYVSSAARSANLAGSAKGGTEAIVAYLEREVNTFAVVPSSDLRIGCRATGPPMFFLTFYRSSASVDVGESGGCGWITNGVRVVNATPAWRAQMAAWTVCHGCRPATANSLNG
jgi:hypothetical protein